MLPGSHDPMRRHADRVRETVDNNGCAAHSLVAASWRRSMLYHGLDPNMDRPAERVEEQTLAQARDRMGSLLEIAVPTLDRLNATLAPSGCSILLSDRDGLLLETREAPGDQSEFARWGLTAGGVWSEAQQGTNGIGTCAIEKRPVIVHQDQHFRVSNTEISCIAAPIFDHLGDLAAVLDISSCRRDLTLPYAQVLGMVVTESARAMESDLFRMAYPGCRIVVAKGHGHGGVSLLALDPDDVITGATRLARKTLGLTDAVLASVPGAAAYLGTVAEEDPRAAEKAALRRALARAKGNVSAAARDLGISRATMYRKMGVFGLDG